MKYKIETSITINATPEKVWDIFYNFKEYHNWNPFISYLKGNTEVGNQIEVKIATMTFKPIVLANTPKKEFTWLGHFLFKGIFDGKHSFKLIDNEDGTTTFIHQEEFRGILVRLMKKKLDTEIRDGFIGMNETLKERCEIKK